MTYIEAKKAEIRERLDAISFRGEREDLAGIAEIYRQAWEATKPRVEESMIELFDTILDEMGDNVQEIQTALHNGKLEEGYKLTNLLLQHLRTGVETN